MSNGNGRVALQTQKAECEAAITDIKAVSPKPDCAGFEPISRGMIALLRCKSAEIDVINEAETSRGKIFQSFKQALAERAARLLFVGGLVILAAIWQADKLIRILEALK